MILANLRAGLWRYATFALGVLAVALLMTGLIFRVRAADAIARADAAESRAKALQAELQAVIESQKAAEAANEALRAKLARPAPSARIREVVRESPSDCAVDSVLSDSLREAVNRANQAAAAK